MADYPESSLKLRREQRKFFRFPVEGAAMLVLPVAGVSVACQMIDLGLEGCRLRRPEELAVGLGMEVEVSFRLAGSSFRFAGSLQWAARNRVLGVQFREMSEERRQELAELLGGLREELEARELEKRAGEKQAREEQAPADHIPDHRIPDQQVSAPPVEAVDGAADGDVSDAKPAKPSRDRRVHERHNVESNARIHFLSLHIRVAGKALDVSMGGCRIRSSERFPVGAFRRVEVEFTVDGMPLLLPGVTQTVHDSHTLGVRFVELTERKRLQLSAVIAELEQRRAEEAAGVV